MKKYHINYANGRYLKSQEYCSNSAKQVGFDEVISYRINDIDPNYYTQNSEILNTSRGAGLWNWKSYFLDKTLSKMNDGDLLVYSDSGSYYQLPVDPLIEKIKLEKTGVLSFELLGLIEKQYTKKDAFVMMELDTPEITDSSQREATYIWLIKNDFTVSLVKEYLKYSQNINIISDLKSVTGENYPEFIDHRHDQSIWSLLCKKYKIPGHRLISQHGDHLKADFPEDTYGQITLHHRTLC